MQQNLHLRYTSTELLRVIKLTSRNNDDNAIEFRAKNNQIAALEVSLKVHLHLKVFRGAIK